MSPCHMIIDILCGKSVKLLTYLFQYCIEMFQTTLHFFSIMFLPRNIEASFGKNCDSQNVSIFMDFHLK